MADFVSERIILARQHMAVIDDDKARIAIAQGGGGPAFPSDDGQVMNIFGIDAGNLGRRPYRDREMLRQNARIERRDGRKP